MPAQVLLHSSQLLVAGSTFGGTPWVRLCPWCAADLLLGMRHRLACAGAGLPGFDRLIDGVQGSKVNGSWPPRHVCRSYNRPEAWLETTCGLSEYMYHVGCPVLSPYTSNNSKISSFTSNIQRQHSPWPMRRKAKFQPSSTLRMASKDSSRAKWISSTTTRYLV
jgi:hypothetical protein